MSRRTWAMLLPLSATSTSTLSSWNPSMRLEFVTEAINRKDNECYYGLLERRKGRVVFSYTDIQKTRRRPNGSMFAEVRRVYPDVLAFSREWTITAQLPLDCDHQH